MDEIHEQTYHWQSPYEQALQADPDTSFSAYENDYASRLWYRTGSQFYKFKSGEWKTYWILGTNCSLFAADLLNRIDPAIHGSKGIVTPGEFGIFEERRGSQKQCHLQGVAFEQRSFHLVRLGRRKSGPGRGFLI